MMKFFWRALRRGDRGFTLIELLIVVAIIAILAAVLIPNFLRSRGQSRVAASKGNMKNLGTALESYFVSAGVYPATGELNILVTEKYIGALPKRPDGITEYEYTGVTGQQSYVVCDDTTDDKVTDAGGIVVWYYNPAGGLQRLTALGSNTSCAGISPP